MSMPNKKLSGALNRKRKLQQEKEAKSSKIMASYFGKKKHINEEDKQEKLESFSNPVRSSSAGNVSNSDCGSSAPHVLNPDCSSSAFNVSSDTALQHETHSEKYDEGRPNTTENERTEDATENIDLIENETKEEATENIDVIPDVLRHKDIGYLKFSNNFPIVSSQLRTEMILHGSHVFKNELGLSTVSTSGNRTMPKSWFTRRIGNEEGVEVSRSWLLYSPKNNAAYCFCCLLFSLPNSAQKSSFVTSGFNKWRKKDKLISHEESKQHRTAFTSWKEGERTLINNTGIDAALEASIQSEQKRWRNILVRIIACLKYLISQNIAFRGHFENPSLHINANVGNFLSLINLVAQFDPLLESHLKTVTETPRAVSYLSPQIQNEIIHLLASSTKSLIINNIKRMKYYGFLIDTTPDLSHREQMSHIFRYVDIDFTNKKVVIKESFLGFIELHAKDALSIEIEILETIKSYDISLAICRSQCYDNAAVMSGHLSGVQQRILEKNYKALFVNCNNHSLNLVGVTAAKQDPVIVTCFGVIENIYLFFSRSTLRWELLKNAVKLTVKLSAAGEISRVIKSVLDRLQEEFNSRFKRLNDLNSKFGFLLDVPNTLKENDVEDLEVKCLNLGSFYNTDFNGNELYEDVCDCKMLLRSREGFEPKTPLELLSFIVSYGEDVFPNLRTALQILLTGSISIASFERSFSKFKLILSYLRTTMGQDRLSDVALLSIEKETFESIDYDSIINEFAATKASKMHI